MREGTLDDTTKLCRPRTKSWMHCYFPTHEMAEACPLQCIPAIVAHACLSNESSHSHHVRFSWRLSRADHICNGGGACRNTHGEIPDARQEWLRSPDLDLPCWRPRSGESSQILFFGTAVLCKSSVVLGNHPRSTLQTATALLNTCVAKYSCTQKRSWRLLWLAAAMRSPHYASTLGGVAPATKICEKLLWLWKSISSM